MTDIGFETGLEMECMEGPFKGRRVQAVKLHTDHAVIFPIFRLGKIDQRESGLAQLVLRLFIRLGWVEYIAIVANSASGAAEDLLVTQKS